MYMVNLRSVAETRYLAQHLLDYWQLEGWIVYQTECCIQTYSCLSNVS